MKILVIEKEVDGTKSEDFKLHLPAEAERVWELYQADIIREIYCDKLSHNAVLILECNDKTEAQEVLATLPLVKEKLIAFDLIVLEPYDGFARLFEK